MSETKNNLSEERTDLSEKRTDWAEDRTLMASERSFTSWIGTALGCVGVAIGLQAVFGEIAITWLPKAVASLFLTVALFLTWSARTRACKVRKRLSKNDVIPPDTRTFTLVSTLVSTAIIATGVVLWLI